VVVVEPFKRTGNTSYQGILGFVQIIDPFSQPGKNLQQHDRIAYIYIVREQKIFGIDTLSVWNVKLGEIR
jgi:hypothetical protein